MLALWDVAGQERFGNMTRVYYKEASGAFVMVDATKEATIDGAKKWKNDLDAKIDWGAIYDHKWISTWQSPVILLVNKTDLANEQGSSDFYNKFCQDNGFQGWLPISVKNNIGIDLACNAMIEICKNAKPKEKYIKKCEQNPRVTISETIHPTIEKLVQENPAQKAITKFLSDVFSVITENTGEVTNHEKIMAIQLVLFSIYFVPLATELKALTTKNTKNVKFMSILKSIHEIITDNTNDDEKLTLITNYILDYGYTMLNNSRV